MNRSDIATCREVHLKLCHFRSTNEYCDVTIRIDADQTFLCHGILLAAISPFFAKMFDKKEEEELEEVSLAEMDVATFMRILKIAYQKPKLQIDPNDRFYDILSMGQRAFIPCYEMHSVLSDFHSSNKYSDVKVRVNGQLFFCHQALLAAASPEIDAAFGKNLKKKEKKELILNDIDPTVLDDVLKFVYESRKPEINESNVCIWLRTVCDLEIELMKDTCVRVISNDLNIKYGSFRRPYADEDVIRLFLLVCPNDITDKKGTSLKKRITEFIVKNFYEFCGKDVFFKIPFEHFYFLIQQIRSQNSAVHFVPFNDDDMLFDIVLRWMYHSYDERKIRFEDLAKLINLRNVSAEYLSHISQEYGISLDEWLSNSTAEKGIPADKCADFLDHLKRRSDRQLSEAENIRPTAYRARNKKALFVYFNDDQDEQLKVISLDKYRHNWFLAYAMEYEGNNYTYESHWQWFAPENSKFLYCIKNNREFCSYESIDVSSTSRKLAPLPINFSEVFACVIPNTSDKMYMYNPNVSFKNSGLQRPKNAKYAKKDTSTLTDEEKKRGVYTYNGDLDQWFSVPRLKTNMNYACLTALDNMLYLIGGQEIVIPYIERKGYVQGYDPRSPSWINLPSTKNFFTLSGCSTLDGKIYVSNCRAAEVFDPVAGKWETIMTKKKEVSNVARVMSWENLVWVINMEKYGELTIINPHEYDTTTQNEKTFVYPTSNLLVNGFMHEASDPEHQRIQDVVVFQNLES